MAKRLKAMGSDRYRDGFGVTLHPDLLDVPRRWKQARTVFVNSMSDLFQKGVPESYVRLVFEVMNLADWHVYQVLTKRADRLRTLTNRMPAKLLERDHIWLGVSVEDRKYGLPRIDELRDARAGVRFLSVEPLLEDLGTVDLTDIDWVIVGGESGPGARPMQKEWVLALRDQCRDADVPFFFKQWGGLRKKIAGRELDGETYDEMPFDAAELVAPPRVERARRVVRVDELVARAG
jgi:protein gp37